MSPKKSPATKPEKFTLSHWYRIVMLPAEIQRAVSALIRYGIDAEKLLQLVAPPKRGRPPSGKPKQDKRKTGRPVIWTHWHYECILHFLAEGKRLLQEQGATHIRDKAALAAYAADQCKRGTIQKAEVKGFTNELIKRLPDAKKAIQKLNDKSP